MKNSYLGRYLEVKDTFHKNNNSYEDDRLHNKFTVHKFNFSKIMKKGGKIKMIYANLFFILNLVTKHQDLITTTALVSANNIIFSKNMFYENV